MLLKTTILGHYKLFFLERLSSSRRVHNNNYFIHTINYVMLIIILDMKALVKKRPFSWKTLYRTDQDVKDPLPIYLGDLSVIHTIPDFVRVPDVAIIVARMTGVPKMDQDSI